MPGHMHTQKTGAGAMNLLYKETHVELLVLGLHHKSIPVLFLYVGWLLWLDAPLQVFLHLNQELVFMLSVTR